MSIYDEIGFYGVSAGDFLAELKGISGDLIVNISSPGGDVFDGIAIYNQLKQRKGTVAVIIDGLAASAASFIAQAATKGKLEIAPHAQMMIHNGFAMGIGNAGDLRTLADQLDTVSDEIAGIYADRTGKPAAYWRDLMRAETWLTDKQAVAEGLADRIHGQADAEPDVTAEWDLSVFAKYVGGGQLDYANGVVVNAEGNHGPMVGKHAHMHPAYKSQGGDQMHSHPHTHGDAATDTPDANHGHHKAATGAEPDDTDDGPVNQLDTVYVPSQYSSSYTDTAQCPKCRLFNSTDAKFCDQCGTKLVGRTDVAELGPGGQLMTGRTVVLNADGPTDIGDGWVMDPDGSVRFDPDGDGDDDSTAEGDTDNDYWSPDGEQLQDIPDCPDVTNAAKTDDDDTKNPDGTKKPFPGAAPPFKKKTDRADFPVLNADVDNTPWDGSKAMAAGVKADDPAKFYAGICAGRKAGDPSTQAAWALPYKYTPDSPPNAAGVRNALSRLPQTKGLTNEAEARSTLETAMKAINPPDPDGPDDHLDAALLAQVFSYGLEGSQP